MQAAGGFRFVFVSAVSRNRSDCHCICIMLLSRQLRAITMPILSRIISVFTGLSTCHLSDYMTVKFSFVIKDIIGL